MAKKTKVSNVDAKIKAECFAWYSDMRAQVSRLTQKIAVGFGRYENQGVVPKEIKAAYRLSLKDDANAEMRSQLRTFAELGIIDFGDDGQADFNRFLGIEPPDPETSKMVRNAQIREAGYEAGYDGDPKSICKYADGTEEAQLWNFGWHHGNDERKVDHPDKPAVEPPKAAAKPAAVASAEPKKRGRPKKHDDSAMIIPPDDEVEAEPSIPAGPVVH